MKAFFRKLGLFAACGFGTGMFAPFAPGTFGSIPGVALAYATTLLPPLPQAAVCLAFALAAIPLCTLAENMLGVKDDGRICADEWMLFPIAVFGIPLASLPWQAMALFFVVTRIFDATKPPPARRLQALPGGLGIVIDDFIANIYALAANWTLYVLAK